MGEHQSIDTVLNLLTDAPEPLFLPKIAENNCFNLDTVASRADKYTKRQVKAAVTVRNLENIIMCPGNRKFTDVCIPNFRDERPVNQM